MHIIAHKVAELYQQLPVNSTSAVFTVLLTAQVKFNAVRLKELAYVNTLGNASTTLTKHSMLTVVCQDVVPSYDIIANGARNAIIGHAVINSYNGTNPTLYTPYDQVNIISKDKRQLGHLLQIIIADELGNTIPVASLTNGDQFTVILELFTTE